MSFHLALHEKTPDRWAGQEDNDGKGSRSGSSASGSRSNAATSSKEDWARFFRLFDE